jgi:hypothetical protein
MCLYCSINRVIYGHVTGAGGQYIYRLHVTDKFIFLGTEKYNDIYSSALYSSVIQLNSSVITDEYVLGYNR